MNVLILTPDAVGSTLLQRLITIYMQFHSFDRPVINLHELTNGLVRYYNTHFQQDVLGKPEGNGWGYYQTLQQVVDLLSSVDHYKTSRLAHYHIRNRQDALDQQIPFYQYLNDNFYVISCRRHNVFEYALSWGLNKITKKLNVYSAGEKINNFFDLYKNGIDVDPNSLVQSLNAYRDYVQWCNNHFNVANYFYYDEHLSNIEKYIMGLPIFSNQPQRLTWQQKFNIDFQSWNQCHYMTSNLGSIALNAPEKFEQISYESMSSVNHVSDFLLSYSQVADPAWPKINNMEDYYNLPEHIRQEVEQQHKLLPVVSTGHQSVLELLPDEHQQFYYQHKESYQTALTTINNLVETGVMITPPPIKKQTLAEKKHIIRNYSHLLDVYNQWIELNPEIGLPIDESTLNQFAEKEMQTWTPVSTENQLSVVQKN